MKKVLLASVSLISVLIVFVFIATSTRPRPEKAAVALAKKEARDRGWNFVTVKSVINKSNRWIVKLESFPPEYGGHATVEIVDGKVTKYRPGL